MDGNSILYLFAAVIVVWVAIFLYLFVVAGRVGALKREMDALDQATDSDDG